jgi:hypothetical protein
MISTVASLQFNEATAIAEELAGIGAADAKLKVWMMS